jgi:hypothetical protein
MKRSDKSVLSVAPSLSPIVVNNDTEGTGLGVDLRGYNTALVVFHVGASGDTLSGSIFLELRVQESADNVTFTDVAAADLENTIAGVLAQARKIDSTGLDEIVHAVGYLGSKRYIRAFVDTTGTHTNGTPCSAVVVRGLPTYAPVS